MSAKIFDPVGPQEMLATELQVLADLIRSARPREVLEVGMANGSSSVAIMTTLRELGEGRLVSIDPFQLNPTIAVDGMMRGFGGAGVRNVEQAGLSDLHTLIPDADYVALPRLLQDRRQFDFIFIDGYHSFDYTLLDFFYADLLLRPGGLVAFHDSSCVAVFRVCEFVANNKAYRRVGPPPALIYASFARRAARRLMQVATGRDAVFRERRLRWKSLAVFAKDADRLADQFVLRGL